MAQNDDEGNNDDEGDINTKADIFRNLEGENNSDLQGVLKEELQRREKFENMELPRRNLGNKSKGKFEDDDELYKERL